MTALLLLIVFGHQWSFFLASFLLGVSRGTRMIVFPPSVKKLSGLGDTTSYFAVGPILTIPFALALPMAYGYFLDRFAYLNGASYRVVFLISLMLVMASLYAVLKVNFQPGIPRRRRRRAREHPQPLHAHARRGRVAGRPGRPCRGAD